MSIWRLGRHVDLHVYEDAGTGDHLDDRVVALFLRPEDAQAAVEAHNAVERAKAEIAAAAGAAHLSRTLGSLFR